MQIQKTQKYPYSLLPTPCKSKKYNTHSPHYQEGVRRTGEGLGKRRGLWEMPVPHLCWQSRPRTCHQQTMCVYKSVMHIVLTYCSNSLRAREHEVVRDDGMTD